MAKPTILQHAPKPISTTKTSRKAILSPSNRLQQPPPPSKFPNQHHLKTHNRHKDTKVNRQKKTKLRPLLIFIYIFACLNNKNITPYCIAPYILLLSSREKNSGAYLRPPSKSATTLTAIPSELSRRSVRLPRDPCITRSNPDQPPKPSKKPAQNLLLRHKHGCQYLNLPLPYQNTTFPYQHSTYPSPTFKQSRPQKTHLQ